MLGTSIGNYQIQRLIGEGGMGKVYLAIHPGIGRQAAVKVLASTEAAAPDVVSRFVTEARASNAIRHPNIVDVYDCGVLPDGRPYIVMEYLDGQSLDQVLKTGPFVLTEVLDWACQIAEALAMAHQNQIVHRDLKPENVFLIPDPRRPDGKQIKILDFGIAKLQHANSMHHTRTGSLLGTPLYMSPEQCMGAKDIDARSDIYAFGVMLYEMTCGRRPFDSEAVYAVINMQINEQPIRPRHWNPTMPPSLEAIILRALAKRPADRHARMDDVLGQLRFVIDGLRANPAHPEIVTPSPDPPSDPSASATLSVAPVAKSQVAEPPRSKSRWLVLAGVTCALGAGVLALSWRNSQPKTSTAPAQVSAQLAPVVVPPAPVITSVEIWLESTPPGAQVSVGDVVVGTTPVMYKAALRDEPLEFVFQADGYEPERIKALPSAGLKLRARLETTPVASEPAAEATPKSAPARRPKLGKPGKHVLPDDIKSER